MTTRQMLGQGPTALWRNSVRVIGLPQRFDVHEVSHVESMIAESAAAGVIVVIDASEVRFMDHAAMDCLVEARLHCMDSGGDLAIAAPSVAARVILELSGRYDALNPIEPAAGQVFPAALEEAA